MGRIGDRLAFKLHRALGQFALGFAVGGGEADLGQQGGDAHPFCAGGERGEVLARAAPDKGFACGGLGADGGVLAAHQLGDRVGEHLLGRVDLRAFERFEPCDFAQRQIGEQTQELAHVAIINIAPILPEVIGGQLVFVEPHRAGGGLAHLGPVSSGEKRGGDAKQVRPVHPPPELDAVDDIAPLVAAAHLQTDAKLARQMPKIITLQDHVIEFEKGHRLFALEPQLY